MRAPVYRSIDTANTFLGLAFPSEVLMILTVFWGTAVSLPPFTGLMVTVGAYIALRVATAGKAPLHLQHLVLLHTRRVFHAGRFSPSSNARHSPAFPLAARRFRDLPKKVRRED